MSHLALCLLRNLGRSAIEMKKFALSILLILLASPTWATTYYLAPASGGGNDSNKGTSANTPWLTPNHPVNCGDVILAAASSIYSWTNFYTGHWGMVTCPAGNNVAWLKCVTFDACKINTSAQAGMWIDQSYWGVQGFEITTPQTDQFGHCFTVQPNFSVPVSIHHIILANDIANGCGGSGFASAQGSNGTAGVDYLVFVGDIAYNTSSSTTGVCNSAFSVYEPAQSDSLPGTHIFIAGNFTWETFDGNPCNGGAPTDGEGIILDTFSALGYSAQTVVQNNIIFLDGGKGIQSYRNSSANVFIKYNTIYGNNGDPHQNSALCSDLSIYASSHIQAAYNLVAANNATGCGANSLYAMGVGNGDSTSHVYNNFAYGVNGQNETISNSPGFSFGPDNILGTDPKFSNPVSPGAPLCGSASSVPNCMATVIANFTPATAAARAYGYQIPSTAQTTDPLFPQWLCNVNLPTGLLTMGCPSAAAPAITGVKVN
jgi:hypothetical protein